jgi:hypothetical protein
MPASGAHGDKYCTATECPVLKVLRLWLLRVEAILMWH